MSASKSAIDIAAGTVALAALIKWLPPIAAAFTIAWTIWRFWHDPDLRRKVARVIAVARNLYRKVYTHRKYRRPR